MQLAQAGSLLVWLEYGYQTVTVLFSTGTVDPGAMLPLIGGGAGVVFGMPDICPVHPDGNAASAMQSNTMASLTLPPKAHGSA